MVSRVFLATLALGCQFDPARVELDDSGIGSVADAAGPLGDAGQPRSIVVNEVAAAGTPDDWFEVKNLSSSTLDLGGRYLTDDLANAPTRGQFMPGTLVAPGGFLQITVTDAWPGFKLAGDEEITLVDLDGVTVIDRADWNEGDSPQDQSYGRMPDGDGLFQTLTVATPGSPNSP